MGEKRGESGGTTRTRGRLLERRGRGRSREELKTGENREKRKTEKKKKSNGPFVERAQLHPRAVLVTV